jgi:segregation and condensation protein B
MRTLQERSWIRVVGHREVPGHPELLGTTREFLDYFGLRSLDQLPTLAELRDVETIGVQLELPGGEAPVEALEIEAAAEMPADEADVSVEAAPEDGEDNASPSLVASADDDEPRTLTDPPL